MEVGSTFGVPVTLALTPGGSIPGNGNNPVLAIGFFRNLRDHSVIFHAGFAA